HRNQPGARQVRAVGARQDRRDAAAAHGAARREVEGGGARRHGARRPGELTTNLLRNASSGLSVGAPGRRLNRGGGPMLEEFKKFAMRGNVVDLAVGVVIGAAFGAIVNSLVADIIMPIIGAITGGLDFSNYFVPLSSKVTATALADAKKQGAVLAWGNFLTILINFIIIAFALFL